MDEPGAASRLSDAHAHNQYWVAGGFQPITLLSPGMVYKSSEICPRREQATNKSKVQDGTVITTPPSLEAVTLVRVQEPEDSRLRL